MEKYQSAGIHSGLFALILKSRTIKQDALDCWRGLFCKFSLLINISTLKNQIIRIFQVLSAGTFACIFFSMC
jgi:hypothetical protein